MQQVGLAARQASALISRATTESKNNALRAIGDEIVTHRDALMAENEKDLAHGRDNGLSEPVLPPSHHAQGFMMKYPVQDAPHSDTVV